MTQDTRPMTPRWMTLTLRAAAVYNVVWGAWVVLFPNQFFDLVGMARPVYPSIWQCVGMIVGVYGLGYWIAARDPARHWPIVLVGFLGKVFGPIGYVGGAFVEGALDPAFGWTIPTNDLIWWVPFSMILWHAFRVNQGDDWPVERLDGEVFARVLAAHPTTRGRTLDALSAECAVLVLFLRHAGCTFCREAVSDLARQMAALRERGMSAVVVTQSDPAKAAALLRRHGLDGAGDVELLHDPGRELYRAFELPRGTFGMLFGPRVWWAARRAVRHGIGWVDGDGLQMGGAFVLRDGRIVAARPQRHAAERVDVCAMNGAVDDDTSQATRANPAALPG